MYFEEEAQEGSVKFRPVLKAISALNFWTRTVVLENIFNFSSY